MRACLLASVLALPAAASAETRSVCKTGGKGLNVRSAPSIHAGRTAALRAGSEFEMIGLSQNGAWVKVSVGGQIGWVSRAFVCYASESAGPSAVAGGGSVAGDDPGIAPVPSGDGAVVSASGAAPRAASGAFVNPVPGACRSSGFGHRRDPFHGIRKFHDGTDYAAANGTPLRSAFAGTVVRAGAIRGYGYAVVVRRDNPDGSATFALYGHMCCGRGTTLGRSSLKVRAGDRVEAGQVIGEVGTTGRSTGPHLHLLMREVPANAGSAYRNPGSGSFFSRRYAANPERYLSVAGCGGRGGTGGADHDHADLAKPAGLARD